FVPRLLEKGYKKLCEVKFFKIEFFKIFIAVSVKISSNVVRLRRNDVTKSWQRSVAKKALY
ncbi:MAG: hypothetical protein ACKO7R_08225, partial [Pseudanabaena sp.]